MFNNDSSDTGHLPNDDRIESSLESPTSDDLEKHFQLPCPPDL